MFGVSCESILLKPSNGSSDSSLSICKNYAKRDERIKLIKQKNAGVGAARNRCLTEAEGEFVCFVDSDDYIALDYIHNLYELIKIYEADLSICGYWEEKEKEIFFVTSGNLMLMTKPKAMEELLKDSSYRGYVWNKLFRNDIIRKYQLRFNDELSIWEDVLFVFFYLQYSNRAVYSPKPMYHYRYVEESITHEKQHIIGVKKSYDAILAKDEMINRLNGPEYALVRYQIGIRYVRSCLAVIRNYGYTMEKEHMESYHNCLRIMKIQEKLVRRNLSIKERTQVLMCKIFPTLILLLYRFKRFTNIGLLKGGEG